MSTVTVTPSIPNVPAKAIKVSYIQNRVSLHYFYWFNGRRWVWQALGNSAEEPTALMAQAAARRWIRTRQ